MNIQKCINLLEEIDKYRGFLDSELGSQPVLEKLSVLWSELIDCVPELEAECAKIVEQKEKEHKCNYKHARSMMLKTNEGIFLKRVQGKIRGIEKIISIHRTQ
jgi:hypothetical protein